MFDFRGTLIFFFTAFLMAMSVEILFRFIATNNPKAFGFAIILYPVFVIFAWLGGKMIFASIGKVSKISGYIAFYLISGMVGLFIFEWLIAGNSPWGNPNANQFAMFSFWALLGFIPRIFSERKDKTTRNNSRIIKKLIVIHFIAYVAVSLVGGMMSPEGFPRFSWIIWSFIISISSMNLYVVWFMLKLVRD